MPGQQQGGNESQAAQEPSSDAPPGYVPPGEGVEDLDPGNVGNNVYKRAAQMMNEADQRATALNSGGFKLDADAIRALQPDWEDIARELQDLRDNARQLAHVIPPAEDDASLHQIKAVIDHADTCANISNQMYEYAYEYARSLENAVNKLEGSDRTAADAARSAGQDT